MIGVIVNVLTVALGGVLGTVFSKKLSTRFTTELNKVFGVCAIGMGISSVPLMQNMPAVILAVVAGTALGLALLALLTLFGDIVLELRLQLTQLAHLGAELDGAADGEHGVHQIDAEDEGRERHGDGRAEIHDVLPQPGLDKVAQQHARKAKACGVQKAHTAIDLEFIMGVVPPAHVEELFHDPAREVFKDRRDDRTEDEREHRILEAAVQKIQHEQRAMAVNGAEEAVEEASLFADVTLGDGAV